MKIGDLVLNPEFGQGEIIGQVHSKLWRVLFEVHGEKLVSNRGLKLVKQTREERAFKKTNEWKLNPFVWAVVGWIATHNLRLRASAPVHLQAKESQRLFDYGVNHEIGKTLTGKEPSLDENGKIHGALGPSYTAVYDDFGFSQEFESQTGIIARPTEHTNNSLSTQQWEFVLVLLLSDLQFELSAKDAPSPKQNVQAIRSRVPETFKKAFDLGTLGDFEKILDNSSNLI